MNNQRFVFLLKVSFVMSFSFFAVTISSVKINQKLTTIVPLLQVLAFSTTSVNQGIQAIKQLSNSKND